MANDLNRCEFIGRLGKDPEMRYMPDGKAVANISLAVGSQWKDKASGKKQEATEWVRIVAFGRLAEIIGEYLKKGSQAFFSGSLKTRKWQDQSGQDRYSTEVVADSMQMLDSRGADGGAGGAYGDAPPAPAYGGAASAPQSAPPAQDYPDDDIPF